MLFFLRNASYIYIPTCTLDILFISKIDCLSYNNIEKNEIKKEITFCTIIIIIIMKVLEVFTVELCLQHSQIINILIHRPI